MPLYLVRWPNLSCSLVRAADKSEVHEILDELDSPAGCEISQYNGPVFVDFELPIDRATPLDHEAMNSSKPLSDADIKLGDVADIANKELPRARIPDVGTGFEMYRAMCAKAFPHLYNVLFAVDDDKTPKRKAVEKAVRAEAMRLVRETWRHAQLKKSKDPIDQIAVMMGTSREAVERMRANSEWEVGEPES